MEPTINFGSLNLATIYSSKGTRSHRMRQDVCFHTVIKDRPISHMNNEYKILVFPGDDYAKLTYRNNICLLSLEEVKDFFEMVKTYCNFEYEIKEKISNKRQMNYLRLREYSYKQRYFEINLSINAQMLVHKFVLKMTRLLYEYPYNIYLVEAMRLKKLDDFKEMSIINLCKMIAKVMYDSFWTGSSDQFICDLDKIPTFMTDDEYKNMLRSGSMFINAIQKYQICRDTNQAFHNDLSSFRTDHQNLNRRLGAYWCNEDIFNARVETYKKVLPYFYE